MKVYAGEEVTFFAHYQDPDGASIAVPVTAEVMLPDGSVVSGSVSTTSLTGVYKVVYTTTIPGPYVCKFTTSSTGVAAINLVTMYIAVAPSVFCRCC